MERKKPNYRPIHCERCGVLCERTNPTQRYCVACREIVQQEQRRAWNEAHSNGGRGKPRFHYQKGRGKEGGPGKDPPPSGSAAGTVPAGGGQGGPAGRHELRQVRGGLRRRGAGSGRSV